MQTSIVIRRLTSTGKGKEEILLTQEVSLGTGPHNTVRFDPAWDRGVAPSHARVFRDAAGLWWLQDAGSNTGTYVNGQRVTMKRQVGGPTVVELGQNGPKIEIVLPPTLHQESPPTRSGKASARHVSPLKWLALTACVAALAASAWYFLWLPNASGTIESTAGIAAQSTWKPQVDMGGQIFPAYLIAIATMKAEELPNAHVPGRMGDPSGIIGIKITSPKDRAKIRINVKANALMKGGSIEVELPEKGAEHSIYPKIEYDYEALLKVRQAVPLTLTMQVVIEGEKESEAAVTVRVASINDCPYSMRDNASPGGRGTLPCAWMFAAYVNENHPFSEEIRKTALQSGLVSTFNGYQSDKKGVLNQVFAIWNVLQQRGMRYSNVTTISGENPDVNAQQVRFLDQSISSAQANCVDGSVIFASLLRQIGIEPVLVTVPGHMFVGFLTDIKDPASLVFLETTVLGTTDLKQISSLQGLPTAIQAGVEEIAGKHLTEGQLEASVQSFGKALEIGAQNFALHHKSIENGEDISSVIIIKQARERGIMPIAYRPD